MRFPGKVLRTAPIAGTAQITPGNFLLAQTMREAIQSDPGWNREEYTSNADVVDGLIRQARILAGWLFSTEFWKREVWRALEFDSKEAFLTGFLDPYFTPIDPNDLLTQSWAWQHGDVARQTGGDLAAALGRITAKTFVMPVDEDQLFPVRDCRPEQEMITNWTCGSSKTCVGTRACSGAHPPTCPKSTGTSASYSPRRPDQPGPAHAARRHPAHHLPTPPRDCRAEG